MEELLKNLRAVDWYGLAALAAVAFGYLKSIFSGWASGRRQERNERFAREARDADITPVQCAPGERTRIQAMEENQHRALNGIAALRAEASGTIALIERLSTYLHAVGEEVSHNLRVIDRIDKDLKCLKTELLQRGCAKASIAPIATTDPKTTSTIAPAVAAPVSPRS